LLGCDKAATQPTPLVKGFYYAKNAGDSDGLMLAYSVAYLYWISDAVDGLWKKFHDA